MPPQLRDVEVFDAGETGCEAGRVEAFDVLSARHVVDPNYLDPPPVGGDHLPCWANYGVYSDPLPPGNWVHNLEHGAVVLLHSCADGCDAEVEAMTAFVEAHERTILTPFPELPTRFAVIAWGYRLLLDCLDMGVVQQFYDAHFNRAPEDVASGAPGGC